MTSVVTLEKQVESIKKQIMPKHNADIVVVFSFGPNSEPHGEYGYRKLHLFREYWINGQQCEAPSTEEEIQYMRDYYDNHLLPETRKKLSFEQFVKQHECKCGKHE